jgi:hypothetical protein
LRRGRWRRYRDCHGLRLRRRRAGDRGRSRNHHGRRRQSDWRSAGRLRRNRYGHRLGLCRRRAGDRGRRGNHRWRRRSRWCRRGSRRRSRCRHRRGCRYRRRLRCGHRLGRGSRFRRRLGNGRSLRRAEGRHRRPVNDQPRLGGIFAARAARFRTGLGVGDRLGARGQAAALRVGGGRRREQRDQEQACDGPISPAACRSLR